MKRTLFCLALGLCLVAMTGEAQAFRFSPFRAKFSPSGANANQLFQIENNTDDPATVQVRITTRDVDAGGHEKNADADKDFSIYPAQVILKPHEKRTVRVQWIGDAGLKEENAYRIVAEQLPVNLTGEPVPGATVKFLLTYRGALFVTPPGLKADVSLASFRPVTDSKGKKWLELTFHNGGTQHALLQNLKLDIKDSAGKTLTLSGQKQLPNVTGEGLLAGQERRLNAPWPKNLSGTPAAVDFNYDRKAF